VGIDCFDVNMWCCILYKGDCLRLSICVCYSWETALYVDPDILFSNRQDWKEIREESGEVNGTKVCMKL
jgi:hypothetical protein